MAIMLTEVYDAFISCGSNDAQARKAAEALSNHDNRFIKIESNINRIESDINRIESDINKIEGDINKIEGDMTIIKSDVTTVKSDIMLLKWMIGSIIAGTASIISLILKAFF